MTKKRRVSIFVPEGAAAMSVTGPMDIFFKANEFQKEVLGKSIDSYYIELVSQKSKLVKCQNDLTINCHRTIKEVDDTDLIIIPSLPNQLHETAKTYQPVIEWINQCYRKGADVTSFCTGAFLLASCGLLKNKRATTHWMAAKLFEIQFPEVQLQAEKIIVDQGRVITSGGATSFMNLCIYLIERYSGKEAAILTSKLLLIDYTKSPQDAYSIFSPQKLHANNLILKAQEYIETNFAKPLTSRAIAEHVGLTERSFHRHFKKYTNDSPLTYLQKVRIEYVKKGLESTDRSVKDIIYGCGYVDNSTFRKLFKKVAGMSPKEYRGRYRIYST